MELLWEVTEANGSPVLSYTANTLLISALISSISRFIVLVQEVRKSRLRIGMSRGCSSCDSFEVIGGCFADAFTFRLYCWRHCELFSVVIMICVCHSKTCLYCSCLMSAVFPRRARLKDLVSTARPARRPAGACSICPRTDTKHKTL